MARYIWLFTGVILGAFGLLGLITYWARRQPGDARRLSWLSYVLLWPAILDADKERRNGRLFTGREWLGWLVVGVLILVGCLVGSRDSGS